MAKQQNPLIVVPTTLVSVEKAPPPYPDFGPYLTYSEGVKSVTAIRKGIVNIPDAEQYRQMCRVYRDFYEPICRKFGKIPVSSFFRSMALNKAVGGSTSSAHMWGKAIDLDCDGLLNVTNKELYQWVRKNLTFDTCIQEFPDENANPGWIHIAYRSIGPNRQQGMRAVKKDGQVHYIYE